MSYIKQLLIEIEDNVALVDINYLFKLLFEAIGIHSVFS